MDGFNVGFVVSIFFGRITDAIAAAAAAAETFFFSVTCASRNKKVVKADQYCL
jgi:hypothetical protein